MLVTPLPSTARTWFAQNAPLSILNASPHGHIAQAQTAPSSSTPSPSAVSSPSPVPPANGNTTTTSSSSTNNTSVSITHHHQTVNGGGSPVNGHATPQPQHRHVNGNGAHYQQQQQQQQLNNSLNGSSGLLSLAEQDHSTPKHGQVRLVGFAPPVHNSPVPILSRAVLRNSSLRPANKHTHNSRPIGVVLSLSVGDSTYFCHSADANQLGILLLFFIPWYLFL